MAASRTQQPTLAKLRQLIRSAPGTPGRAEAFGELVERSPRNLNRTLISLAGDAEIDPAMRAKAVAALGRTPTPAAIDALCELSARSDGIVVRRSIETLGKVGRAADLDLLRSIATDDATTERVLRAAKLFVSYRHGLGAYRFDVPRRSLAASEAESVPIRTGAPTKKMRAHLELLAPRAPGVAVDPVPARRLVCGGNEYALMLDRGVETAQELTVRQAIPAVLMLQNIESGEYEAGYYLMTDPTGPESFRIFGVRSSGRVGLHGEATVEGSSGRFEVHATEEPLDHPLTVGGTFDSETGTVRFHLAIVDTGFSDQQQARRRQPRLIDRPDR